MQNNQCIFAKYIASIRKKLYNNKYCIITVRGVLLLCHMIFF